MGLSSKQVSADTLDWSQIGGDLDIPKPTNEANNNNNNQQQQQQKRPLLKCPRCDSSNTKFCYYNNYSKLQPRHFCRTCKRHWTEGGTLRNVPVGGGRKNKRAKTSNNVVDDVNGSNQQQQMQGVAVPLSDTAIFPDIFRQVMYPSENYFSGCASSSTSSSLCNIKGQELVSSSEENMLDLMDGYNCGGWLQGSLAQPDSYWNCWDGIEFDASGIKLSAPNASK